jgi:UDP-N-acetylmuramoyl-tripeptide--D-alanyl-D-alanine ligase
METIKLIYQRFLEHPNIVTDSRQCSSNSLFFALKGEKFDGNQFAEQALIDGCNYAIVDDKKLVNHPRIIVVDDVLEALQQLAHYHRKQLSIPIIGITGTNGKTTTKELISVVLSKKYAIVATKGNLNNHIGVPLTLLTMNRQTEIGIVEMGANHQGEINELCQIADPDFGIITNIGHAHLEGFGSFEGVKKTKKELYDYILNKRGTLFVNAQDELLMSLSTDHKRELYSSSDQLFATDIKVEPYLSFSLSKGSSIETQSVAMSIVGKYNINNALAAACIGNYFGVALPDIASALSNYVPTNNRSQLIKTERNDIIMDAYNANPSSMKVAIENFNAIEHPNKVVILGGMKELGETSTDAHYQLFTTITQGGFSKLILIGDEFLPFKSNKNVMWYSSSEALIPVLQDAEIRHALILIKGSRSNRLEMILPYL